MMSFKTKFEILLATISIYMTQVDVMYGIDVKMNENFTATVGEAGEINCSFSKENVKKIYTVGLFIRNKTTHALLPIVTFLPGETTSFTPSGKYLRNRVTVTNITQNSTEAKMIFNQLKCTDQNQYLCKVTYLTTDSTAGSDMSQPTTIDVTVLPKKPIISRSTETTSPDNHNVKKSSISASETFNRTSITLKTTENDQDFSSTKSTTTAVERKQFPQEGDKLTFICSGNVGRPAGFMMWHKIHTHENRSFNYGNETTTVEKIPGKCSLNGTSSLTFQLSASDFKGRIRCSVVSQVGNPGKYVETDPLDIYFSVRHVSITKLPNKEIFDPSIKNIILTCNSDGNPEPSYIWYKRKNTNTILSRSYRYVINNVIKYNSGIYICEVHNFINGEKYNASSSVEITIENTQDTSKNKNNNLEMDITLMIWIGIGIAVFAGFFIFAFAIYRRRAKRKRLHGSNAEPTSESFSKNCARDNPCYTSDSETNIYRNIIGCGNAMEARNCTLENEEELKVEQEDKEIDFGNPTIQTNNEAASYAYVTVSSDYYAGKVKSIDSQDILMSRISEKNKPSTTASSEYAKESMDQILKNRNKNTCDNSPDQYASSVPGIYDALHDKRHKKDNGEQFDRMSELKRLNENRNESIERNKSIEHQDSTMLNCQAPPLEKSKPGGYESFVIEGDVPVLSSEGNGSVHDDIEIVRQHNKEYLQNQKQEEEKLNKSPISNQPVEYAQVNETTMLKNRPKHNETDQETVDKSAKIHEGNTFGSEERHAKINKNADHFDKIMIVNKENSDVEIKSTDNHIVCNINQTFENDSVSSREENIKVEMVFPSIRSSGSSAEHKQKETRNAETKDSINLSQKVDDDDDESCNTTKKHQTNCDPESSIRNDQTNTYTNQAFETDENQKEDAASSPFRSPDGLQDDGEKNQNSDHQAKNDYENVESTDQPETSNGDTIN